MNNTHQDRLTAVQRTQRYFRLTMLMGLGFGFACGVVVGTIAVAVISFFL